jgi:steroid delta-isomerase-like uncharacterized protein
MSSTEQNKAAVRECFANASRGNFDALEAIISPSFVMHPDGVRGLKGLRDWVEGHRRALPDMSVTIEHQFGDGDYVATRTTVRGRHEGELMGVPPTGREVEFTCLTLSRCRDGKIEEEWELADTVGFLRQIGALPEPAQV